MSKHQLLRRIVRLPFGKLSFLLEATWWLCVAWVAIRTVPFPRIAAYIGTMQAPSVPVPACSSSQRNTANRVAQAVRAVAINSPIQMVCLPQALAAWQMLHLRRVPARLHFGKPAASENNAGDRQNHAWLTSAGVPVTGYPVAYNCVELGFFSRS